MNNKDRKSGYIGNVDDWNNFLSCWEKISLDLLATQDELYSNEEEQVFLNRSQRFEPANIDQIRELEARLKSNLPKSYRDFLLATNGWIQLRLDGEDGVIYPAYDVEWFSEKHPDMAQKWIDTARKFEFVPDHEYFVYNLSQDPVRLRGEYFKKLLVISEVVDSGVYLLNPNVKTLDEEWEAWFLSWRLPGAFRFPSFAHLMRYAHYKATKDPEFDGIYAEKDLMKTCANLLPLQVENENNL